MARKIEDGPENVIWRWKPDTKPFVPEDPHRHDDIAEEYAIELWPDGDSGIVLWGKFHGEWKPNPWNSRAVIVKLLNETGMDLPLPRKTIYGESEQE